MRFKRAPVIALAMSLSAAAVGGAVFFGMSRSASGQVLAGASPVADVSTCPIPAMRIARSPYIVRIQRQFTEGTSVITLDGVFAAIPAGTTFHVTHVSGMFFTPSPMMSQIRLYRAGEITAGFNLVDAGFTLQGSNIQSRTLNQPVDLNFPIGNDPGEWDLQLIRSGSNGIATGIAEFWGYLTNDACAVRGS